jgi:Fe-S oxidoreductase
MPERIDYWGIPLNWRPDLIVYSLMFLAAIILLIRFYQQGRLWWQIGRMEVRWNKIPQRIGRLISYAIVQTRVLRQRYPGIMHIGLAWSFFVFFLGTALATIDSHFIKFLQGNPYLVYKFVLDAFIVFFVIGAILAGYRRFITRPARLTLEARFTVSLALIGVIVLAGLTVESLRLAVERPAWALWSPVGWLVAQIWIASGASAQSLTNWHTGLWLFHLVLAAVTVATLPIGSLWHTLTGPLNTFFSQLDRPLGQLKPVAVTANNESIYVKSLSDLTWKQLLDGDACTECGRCQDACPAHTSGKSLSPKQVILSIRQALHRDGATLLAAKSSQQGEKPKQLVGEDVTEEDLWSCTTCGACVGECPVLIEHVDAIVDMRRYLVIEGQMDGMLQDALANLGRYGNSFGQSDRMRAKWTQPIQPKIKDARREPVEYCWFVGDYASYSASLTDITQKTASVFQKIGLDFGILYESERNAGNDVRRAGEEGLFEMLEEKNMAVLNKCNYQSIVTTDPHSYNTLKNEYVGNGKHPVLHYSELLDQLIASGKLKFSKKLGYKVTYHDPCYLGRYNGVFDAPRRVIEATGCELVEMPRNRSRSYCCGAGGGRIWMEEGQVKERPSEARINEAASLNGVNIFVVACPKDVTMYKDAVKTTGKEDRIMVKDLIELVDEAL